MHPISLIFFASQDPDNSPHLGTLEGPCADSILADSMHFGIMEMLVPLNTSRRFNYIDPIEIAPTMEPTRQSRILLVLP